MNKTYLNLTFIFSCLTSTIASAMDDGKNNQIDCNENLTHNHKIKLILSPIPDEEDYIFSAPLSRGNSDLGKENNQPNVIFPTPFDLMKSNFSQD